MKPAGVKPGEVSPQVTVVPVTSMVTVTELSGDGSFQTLSGFLSSSSPLVA